MVFTLHKLKLFLNLIFGCIGSLPLHADFLSLLRAGATLCCALRAGLLFVVVRGPLIAVASIAAEHRLSAHGLSAHGPQQLWHMGFSSCGSWALEHRLSSCGSRA